MSWARVAAALLALYASSAVQAGCGSYVPSGLRADEQAALNFADAASDAAYCDWRDNTHTFELVRENLYRVALLDRCTRLTQARPEEFHFNPAIRAVVQAGVSRMRRGDIAPMAAADLRFVAKARLWAYAGTPAPERRKLQAFVASPRGAAALQTHRALTVVDEMAHGAIDLLTGEPLAVMPILLKAYFRASQQGDWLDRALSQVDPQWAAQMRKVNTLGQHTSADAQWLAPLAAGLAQKAGALSRALVATLPADRASDYKQLLASAYYQRLGDAEEALAFASTARSAAEVPERLRPILQEIGARYPAPAKLLERVARPGPRDYFNDTYRTLC